MERRHKIHRDQYEKSLADYKEVLQDDLREIIKGQVMLYKLIKRDQKEEDIVRVVNLITDRWESYKDNLDDFINKKWNYGTAKYN